MIRWACRQDDLDLDATQAERLWRAASGAAHGMYWTNLELTNIEVGEEYEPGHFRNFTLPDLKVMHEALRAGYQMTQYGALKYVHYAGADIDALYSPARRRLADTITLKPNRNPEVRRHLAGNEPTSEE